jgi:hypothetical protein
MKTTKIYFIIILLLLLIFTFCKNNEKTTINDSKTNQMNNLPYTTDNSSKYYKSETDSLTFLLDIKDKQKLYFNTINKKVEILENDNNLEIEESLYYYVIEEFYFSFNQYYKLIIYKSFIDNQIEVLNIQLNNYYNKELVQQILLDSRFTFENEYFRNFYIDKNMNIEITKYEISNLEFNEVGDIVGELEKPDTLKTIVKYKLDKDGKFKKTK